MYELYICQNTRYNYKKTIKIKTCYIPYQYSSIYDRYYATTTDVAKQSTKIIETNMNLKVGVPYIEAVSYNTFNPYVLVSVKFVRPECLQCDFS